MSPALILQPVSNLWPKDNWRCTALPFTVDNGRSVDRSMTSILKALAVGILAAAAVCAGTTGSISGTIKDQSGAVIPGAKLTVTHTTQGIVTKTTSDTKGDYTFPSLPVGRYDLQVVAQGFKAPAE